MTFTGSGGSRTWLLRPQVLLTVLGVMVQPDFVLTRQDSRSAPIAIFLDGKQFHASAAHNRTADDAVKRAALRDAGYRVFSLTYADVADWETRLSGGKPSLDPLVPGSTGAQVQAHVADPLVDRLWGPPVDLLTSVLEHPDAEVWATGAGQLVARVAVDRSAVPPVPVAPGTLSQQVALWARGGQLSPAPDSASTAVMAFPASTFSGLPLLVALDASDGRIGAVTVLDDRAEVVGSDAHDTRWRDWLRWMNVLQFLGSAGPASVGFGECWTILSLPDLAQRDLTFRSGEMDVGFGPDWQQVIEFSHESVHDLIRALSEAHYAVPEPGGEVGDGDTVWQVELGWPDAGVAVVLDELADRDAWLARNGWTVVRHGQVDESMRRIAEAFGQRGGQQ